MLNRYTLTLALALALTLTLTRHLMLNRYTLLSRIFGLHRVQMRSGRRVFFVVMGGLGLGVGVGLGLLRCHGCRPRQ